MPGSTNRTEVYYRFTDADGRVHLVSSLDAVPHAARPHAQRLELAVQRPAETAALLPASGVATWLVAGAGGVLLLLLLGRYLPGSVRWLAKVAAFAVVVLVLGGLYLGALRRATGAGDAALVAPSAIIQDAQQAVEKMNQRQKLRDEELRRIQSEAR